MQSTITCKSCGETMSLDEALLSDLKKQTIKELSDVHKAQMLALEEQLSSETEKRIKEVKMQTEELAMEKISYQIKASQEAVEEAKKDNSDLREQLKVLMQQIREVNKAKDEAELNMQKKLAVEEIKIQQEAINTAEEKYHLKNAELEKQLTDTKKALSEANRKAEQGSQQNQGEVLELELETRLREEFPLDEINEVKKGQRGADIIHLVQNKHLAFCGTLLWETKNGKWQPAWIAKFKQDIRDASAHIGVIVSVQLPQAYGDMKHIEGNIWVVKPRLAPMLAYALRNTILQVDATQRQNTNKDVKLEALYQFLVGPEFHHRVEAIIESYNLMQDELEKEKRSSQLRWTRQEKSIRSMIDNTIGMYGDLQGITNRALPIIKTLELEAGEIETTKEK